MKYDVLVYGPMFCDLVFTGLQGMPELGREHYATDLTLAPGGSAIAAVGMQRLGVRVGLIADLGNDPLSGVLWDMLEDFNLDRNLIRRLDQPLHQITVALSFPEDRTFITRFEHPETRVDLQSILEKNPGKHLHVGSFLAVMRQPAVCRIAHSAGMTVSLDPGWDEKALRDPTFLEAAADVDYFLPSRSELCWMAEECEPEKAAARLLRSMKKGAVVMKNGPEGATTWEKDRIGAVHVPSLPVQAVDTTGAGDAFDAGFIAALIQGRTLEDCMQHGVVCGSLAVTGKGGLASLPYKEELEEWVSRLQS